jgi:glyoxylase-like metal-dependent hydrolase (beta-lactamase superfamily II)
MKIHPIRTGSVVVKKKQRDGSSGSGYLRLLNTLTSNDWTDPLPIYAWVIEHPEGIIVIDTGETSRTGVPGYFPWWHPYYRYGVNFDVRPKDEIGPQLRKIGIFPGDVRWVILTHLHTDHAGGLFHFPDSEILVSQKEYNLASGLVGKLNGYLPDRWPNWFKPTLIDYQSRDEAFRNAFLLTESNDVRIVPTPGHTPGHQSVIFQDRGITYFFAGDASYTKKNLKQKVIDGVSLDLSVAKDTLDRINKFVTLENAVYLPSHDPESSNRLRRVDKPEIKDKVEI